MREGRGCLPSSLEYSANGYLGSLIKVCTSCRAYYTADALVMPDSELDARRLFPEPQVIVYCNEQARRARDACWSLIMLVREHSDAACGIHDPKPSRSPHGLVNTIIMCTDGRLMWWEVTVVATC